MEKRILTKENEVITELERKCYRCECYGGGGGGGSRGVEGGTQAD